MLHQLFAVLHLLIVLVLLVGCGAPSASESGTTSATPAGDAGGAGALSIVDGAGTTLTFDQPPTRIVCTYSRCMELLAALELDPIGVTASEQPFVNDPAYVRAPDTVTILPYDGDVPDLEQLAALTPDLVFGWEELKTALGNIAPVYVVANDQDSYQKSHSEIRAFARLLGREQIAERNIQRALDRLAAYAQRSPKNVSVMYGFFYEGTFSYRDQHSGTGNLLKEIARYDWPDPTNSASWSVEINDEGLLSLNPDVLLVDTYGFTGKTDAAIIAEISQRPLWTELSAVKQRRVYVSSDAVSNMDGMGTVGMSRMLDTYAPLIYPDVFPAPLTEAEVAAIVRP